MGGPERFCAFWLTGVVTLMAAVAAFDVVIDPWLVFGAPRVIGLSAKKPETETHTRLAKDYLLRRTRPSGLMIGDSKVDIGLDPSSPAWPDDARPTFNLGLPGAGVAEMAGQLKRAFAIGSVRRVLVLLEMRELMSVPVEIIAAGDGLAAEDHTPGLLEKTAEFAQATMSLDALRASVQTLFAQHRADSVDMTDHGSTGEGGFRGLVRTDGADSLFVQKNTMLLPAARKLSASLAIQPDAPLTGMDAVRAIVTLCRMNGASLDLVIAPGHSDALDSLNQAGLWPRYETVKRALTAITAASNTTLWDFNGYDAYSTEPVPAPSDRRSETQWFWDPAHFKKALGEVMLATIYRGGTGYGVRLTPSTIEARLAAQRAAQAAYAAQDSGWRGRMEHASN